MKLEPLVVEPAPRPPEKKDDTSDWGPWYSWIGPGIMVSIVLFAICACVATAYSQHTRPYPAEVIGVSMHYNRGPVYRIHLKDPRWFASEWTQDVPEGVYRTFCAGDQWPTDYDRATMQRVPRTAEAR